VASRAGDETTTGIGRRHEELAARHLKEQGFEILERNVRLGPDELDIVASDGDEIVFVEVRARAADALVSPERSVSRGKRSRLFRAAARWLAEREMGDRYCRFDLVAIRIEPDGGVRLRHWPGAYVLR
jgi:putative endonuclease